MAGMRTSAGRWPGSLRWCAARFGVEYTLAGMDLLLHRIGWSVQVPAQRAAERDEARDHRLAGGDLARGKRTAADLGGWIVFEDESGQGLRPPVGRTWGPRGHTPVVTVTGGSNKRVSLAALIAIKAGHRPRLIYRVHQPPERQGPAQRIHRNGLRPAPGRRPPAARRAGGARLGQPEHPRQRGDDRADRGPGLADRLQLPPYAHELNPVELVWSHLKRSLANLAKRNIAQLTALVKTRLKRMQYRPGLLDGFLASTHLDLTPLGNPHP